MRKKKDTVRSLRVALRETEAVLAGARAEILQREIQRANLLKQVENGRPAVELEMLKARTQFLNALGQGLAALADAGKMTVGKEVL